MDEHTKYLSDRLLSEELPVTYRLLSRALDVHVNTAKEMLYEFKKYQNSLRANSVYATYLVYGTKTDVQGPEAGDTEMMGSSIPEPDSFSDYVPTKTVTIVSEEKLKDILAEYREVSSIHIYSLAPHPQTDLSLLADISKSMSEHTKKGDIAVASEKYGTITNPLARRKDRKDRPAVPVASMPKPTKQAPASKATQAAKVKQEAAETPTSNSAQSPSAEKKPAASLKRGGSGGIMQSFAKAAAKPPRPKPAVKRDGDDGAMALSDDGEADDSDLVPTKKTPIDTGALKNTRKEREEALRRMMEDHDENEVAEDKEDEPADEEMEEASEPEPELELELEPQPKEEPAEVVSSSENGRRRGKRRVMKKKRILDEQGYMVTIQEAGWESFSEDEAQPVTKPTPGSTPASSAPKQKKAAGKSAGQGNIMSFFSKK